MDVTDNNRLGVEFKYLIVFEKRTGFTPLEYRSFGRGE